MSNRIAKLKGDFGQKQRIGHAGGRKRDQARHAALIKNRRQREKRAVLEALRAFAEHEEPTQ